MDDDSLELAKALAEGGGKGLVGPAVDAIRAFGAAIFGDTTDAVDGYLADRINGRRILHRIEVVGRAKRLCDEWGVEPQEVGLKTAVPLLEAAGNEDDGGMRERWARLLANAAAGHDAELPVYPSFVRILAELDTFGASLVDWLYDRQNEPHVRQADSQGRLVILDLEPARLRLHVTGVEFDVIAENVIRLGLAARPLRTDTPRYDVGSEVLIEREALVRTELGAAFVRACGTTETPP